MSTRRTFLGRAFGACSVLFAARGLSAQSQMQMPMPAAGNTRNQSLSTLPQPMAMGWRIHRRPRPW